MTYAPNTPRQADVFGPYTQWPRQSRLSRTRLWGAAGLIVAAGLFVHCVLPMILGS